MFSDCVTIYFTNEFTLSKNILKHAGVTIIKETTTTSLYVLQHFIIILPEFSINTIWTCIFFKFLLGSEAQGNKKKKISH